VTQTRTFVVIDGYSLAFRAYYAYAAVNFEMASSSGMPTTALHGFTRMIADVYRDWRPDYFAVALDHPGSTFRDELFDEYKGGRAETPEGLRMQLDALRPLLAAIGVPSLEVSGFEADDVIATLVERARRAKVMCRVITGDRDTLQLVEDGVCAVMLTRQGVSHLEEMTEQAVKDKYGVMPTHYQDFAALRGDSSDNLPGVPGIGPKTAAKLIAEYGSVEKIRENVDSLPPRIAKAVREFDEQLVMGLRLTALVRDVPLDVDFEDLAVGPFDQEAARRLLVDNLELRSSYEAICKAFEQRGVSLLEHQVSDRPVAPELRWEGFDEVARAARRKGRVYLAATLGEGQRLCVVADGVAAKASLESGSSELECHFGDLEWCGFGLKEFARHTGVTRFGSLRDLGVLAGLCEPTGQEPDFVGAAKSFLASEGPARKWANTPEECAPWLEVLSQAVDSRLEAEGLVTLARDVEIPLTSVLLEMERDGVQIDVERLSEITADLSVESERCLSAIREMAGEDFNPNSSRQLGVILFEKLGLPRGRRTKTGYSTDARVLERLRDAHPIVNAVLGYREVEKLRSTFAEGLKAEIQDDGRIHATYHQMGARTGRISSDRPNLQNIPIRSETGKAFREIFVAAPGYLLIAADYSQIELRVLAHLSGDERLIAALSGGADVHRSVAASVFRVEECEVTPQQRSIAKMVVYGLSFGMEAYGLSQRLGVSTEEAGAILSRFFEAYPVLDAYRSKVVNEARERGYTMTLLGRRRYLPDLNSRNHALRESAQRQAMNAATQGLAADIFKIALIEVARRLEGGARLVLQVHDEVVVEGPEDAAPEIASVVAESLTGAMTLAVPLVVDVGIGSNWAAAKSGS